jgi:hypothetical protein
VKGEGKDEEVKVQDIAEMLLEAIESESTLASPVTADRPSGL